MAHPSMRRRSFTPSYKRDPDVFDEVQERCAKDLKWIRYAFIALVVASLATTLLLGRHFSHAILFSFIAYILMNIVGAFFKR